MTGRTGYTPVVNGDVFDPPADITDVYEHFDLLIGESRATVMALPSSGNWVGRSIMVESTKLMYTWTGAAWEILERLSNVQRDATNSQVRTLQQQGDSKMAGNGNPTRALAVTFPVAFASGTVPMVYISLSGQKASGAYDPANAGVTSTTVSMASYSPSNVGFTAHLRISTGNLTAGTDYYYTWIAIGVPA